MFPSLGLKKGLRTKPASEGLQIEPIELFQKECHQTGFQDPVALLSSADISTLEVRVLLKVKFGLFQ
jgi:hypothetical protein